MAEGSYRELQASGLDFTKLLGSSGESTVVSDNESSSKYASSHALDPRSILSRQVSIQSVASSVEETKLLDPQEEPIEVAETRSSGNISLTVYSSYFSAGGNVLKISFLLFMCIFTQALASGGDYWITYWYCVTSIYYFLFYYLFIL